MARILYGIMGDSRGHLSRSLSVAQNLTQHELLFVGGGTVLELKDMGYNVLETPMLATIYNNTSVDFKGTVTHCARELLRRNKTLENLCGVVNDYNPNLIISDYEYFLPLAARRLGRPCLSLDHQHVLTHCVYTPPKSQKLNRLLTYLPIKHLHSNATRFLISSFFELPVKNPRTTEIAPPILRDAVREHTAEPGEHVLVYSSGGAYEAIVPYLQQLHRPCMVYGFGERPKQGNLYFKGHSQDGFLKDLTTCRFVISNGGHNLISEALYYVKPVLCLPIQFLYEQFINSFFLQQFGLGEMCIKLANIDEKLQSMERNYDQFREQIGKYNFWGNDIVISRLEKMINGA